VRNALLLERCEPGTPLLDLGDDDAGDVVAGLLRRLWKAPPPELRLLADVAARWADELPAAWRRLGRPFDRSILDAAVGALRDLGPTQGPLVLANEDLHADNVLRAAREPWLVIDPKPIAAEREFTAVAMVRDRKQEVLAGERPAERLQRRLDRLSADLEVDRERVRAWTVAHTIAWGFDPEGFLPEHAAIARLLLD
jgi:streptomycin 6-kinase